MAATMIAEAQKKNTDCVYFLASPLTCKKGNDCEFRHSETARNNPRDCWYWLSGSCLNANCAFRHPPLEAIPEGELAAGGRSRIPCFYFMQGYCVKGDKCNFMHGPPTASAIDVSQKVSKPNDGKTEVPESQTSANEGNGSAASKGSGEVYEVAMEVPSQKAAYVVKEVDLHVTNRLPECSESSAPARSRLLEQSNLSDRSKQVPATNGRLDELYSSDGKLLHQETQAEDEQLCGLQTGDHGLGQGHFEEDQIQEGTESEEMWEESSFDVLVDDGGTDQMIYADELDYLNPYDTLVERLTRGADGFVDFDYDHVAAYGQYYDAEYELATYDAYEQQLLYEHLASLDPEDSMQPNLASKNRQGKDILQPRVRRDVIFGGEGRPQRRNVDSNDLRNHIAKRRRAEKSQKYGDDHNRRRHQDGGPQHNRRHQDGHFKQWEVSARQHLSPRSGSRSNRQYAGRGEPVKGRQFHGHVESGAKRPFRDLASDREEMSAERGSGNRFRALNDAFRSKARKDRGHPAITGVNEDLGSRGYQHARKVESRKDDTPFTGPKSLSQIKAEKLKALKEQGLAGQQDDGIECNGTIEEAHKSPASQMKNKVSHRFYKETVSKDIAKCTTIMMPMEAEFEGPKPLSVILRQKRKVHREGNTRDSDEKYTGIEDVSVGPKTMPCEITMGLGERRSHLRNTANSVISPTNSRAHHAADNHGSRLVRDVDSAMDTEDGLDAEDNAMEDVDFEDDDEDDFAKKLGGFLS